MKIQLLFATVLAGGALLGLGSAIFHPESSRLQCCFRLMEAPNSNVKELAHRVPIRCIIMETAKTIPKRFNHGGQPTIAVSQPSPRKTPCTGCRGALCSLCGEFKTHGRGR